MSIPFKLSKSYSSIIIIAQGIFTIRIYVHSVQQYDIDEIQLHEFYNGGEWPSTYPACCTPKER
jgi:hypothetical protein